MLARCVPEEIFSGTGKRCHRGHIRIPSTLDQTSGYATWFTAGGAICIAHYDVIDDVITRKLHR